MLPYRQRYGVDIVSGEPLELEHARCPVCLSDDYSEMFKRPDLRLCCSPHRFTIVRCKACGMGYVLDRPTEASLPLFYPARFYATNHDRSGQLRPLQNKMALVARHAAGFSGGRLLDLGCAGGEFVAFARQHGWQASGYDWTTSLSNQTSLPIQYGGDLAALYGDASFDVITAWAVMEHVYSLRDTMRNISRMLRPGGIFIALVTNFDSIPGHYMQGDDIPRHLNLFTPRSFDRLLEEYGMRAVERLFDQKIFMGTHRGLLVYLLKRLAGEPLSDIVSQHRAPGRRPEFCGMLRGRPSALTRAVCWFDRTLFAPVIDKAAEKLGKGLTLTVIARKNA